MSCQQTKQIDKWTVLENEIYIEKTCVLFIKRIVDIYLFLILFFLLLLFLMFNVCEYKMVDNYV